MEGTTHTEQLGRQIRRWTQSEEVIVLNNIKSFPDNLREAFRQSYLQLKDRNLKSIEQKYYSSLRHTHPNTISVGSSKGFTPKNTKNRANKSDDQATPLTPKLKPFQRIVMDMMHLPQSDINKILEFFK